MLSHLVHFLVRIASLWLHHYGTTALGLACGLFSPVRNLYRRWKGGEPVRNIWAETGRGVLVVLVVWFALLVYCVGEAVYQDHQYLVSASQRNAHRPVEQLTKPNIKAEAVEFNTAPLKGESRRMYPQGKKGDALVTLIVRVTSLGIPSVAEGWTLSIKLPNGQIHTGLSLQLPRSITLRDDHLHIQKRIFAEDALYDKATKTPIATGAVLYGALMFYVDAPYKEVTNGSISLGWADVTGKQSRWESPGTFPMSPHTYPGMRRY